MSARSSLLLLAVFWIFAGSAQAAQWILSPSVEKDFVQFIQNVEAGKLDPELKTADVSIEASSAKVDLVYKSGAKRSFVLQKAADGAPGYFDIQAGSGATAEDVPPLVRELNAVFKTNPWTVSRPMPSTSAVEPSTDAAGKSSGSSSRVARWMESDIGKSEVVSLSFVLAMMLLVGTALVWLSPVDLGREGDGRS